MSCNTMRLAVIPAMGAAIVLLALAGTPHRAAAQDQVVVNMIPPGNIVADGQTRSINFVVSLSSGMLVTDAQITWAHADKGTLSNCVASGGGIMSCSYASPAGDPGGQAHVMMDITAAGQTISKHFALDLVAGAAAPVAPPAAVVVPVAPPVTTPPVTTTPAVTTTPVTTTPVTPVAPPVTTPPVTTTPVTPVTPPVTTTPVTTPPATTTTPATTVVPVVPVAPPQPVYSFFTVSSDPWAHVLLDGTPVGVTPLERYAMTPGAHTLVLKCGACQEYQEKTFELNMAPGESFTLAEVKFVQTTPASTAVATTTPATTTTPAAVAVTGTAKFPYTEQPYRMGRLVVKYPVVGYQYSQAPGDCGVDGTCVHFVDVEVAGPDGGGLVFAPASIAVEGEFFPIEFVGIHAGFSRVGYSTSQKVVKNDGSDGNFGDGIHKINVGARFRLPVVNNRPSGPLDIIADLGYQGQDFIYFQTTDQENAWTYSNFWAHGFRFGAGMRFQAIQQLVIHGDWHGMAVANGIIASEVELGVEIRPYKMVVLDISWLLTNRFINIEHAQSATETATITDMYTGVGISAGIVF